MQSRHRRAMFWTLGIAAVLAGPLAYRIWLQADAETVAMPNLGDVQPFVYHDTRGQSLTRETLRRGVTVVIHIPKNCPEAECGLARAQARTTETWIKTHLTIRHAEEKNPLFLLSTGGGFNPADRDAWQVIDEDISDGTLLPSGHARTQAWLVVIDPWLSFGGAWDLTKPIDQRRLERVLSRTTFEQYMGNYLARRTFMGPKRDAR